MASGGQLWPWGAAGVLVHPAEVLGTNYASHAVAAAGTWSDYKRVAAETEKVIHRGTTGGISFKSHAGLAYPGQVSDPSLGQAHLIVQLQDGEHVVISPDPYTTGGFQTPPWFA